MSRTRRFGLLLLPVLLGLLLSASPGHAQEETSARYAFSDTTLLRDTLGLHFERLFPLADSLGLTPDTLRALSIRYRWTLPRLVRLADSLRMTVDSVGVYLQRERFNPLSGAAQHTRSFNYTSTYNIEQTSTVWGNALDYKLVSGPVFVQNTTNVQMDRYEAGDRTSLRQTRSSVTEGGWKFSKGLSVGARANLDRFNSHDPGSISNQGESKDEYQFSMRSRHNPFRGLTTQLNFFTGLLNLNNLQQIKRGTSGDLNGSVRLQTPYFTHDFTGQVNGNLARTRIPSLPVGVRTNDLSNNLRGTLGLLPSWPVGLNLNYVIRRTRVETPRDTGGGAQSVRTNNSSVDAALRLRSSNDRYVNLTGRLGSQEQHQGTGVNSLISRKDLGFGADGRVMLLGWDMQSRFGYTRTRSEYPTRSATGGYGESLRVATVDATVSRSLGRRFLLRATGSVSLTRSRSFVIGNYPNPPVNRDQYAQDYRVEANYNRSEALNTAVALAVSRDVLVNIPAASVNGNNEERDYRVEWRWSYRMMRGLTATQNNSVTAGYTHYNFLPANDRLSLDYNTLTTLNAVLSPRFAVDVRHNARHQPSGAFTQLADGLAYLSRSEVNENYTLSARLSYAPAQTLSFYLEPNYLASGQDGSQSGVLSPTRRSRQLNFSGGASLNLSVGGKGRLTGDIVRTYRADRSMNYTGGIQVLTPRSESDFWNGSLQLTWQL